MKPRHISAMRQTRGYAIDQQAMNRLQHARWQRSSPYPRFIASIALFCVTVASWAFLMAFVG